jgi:SAM-dependent methyltransferase
MDADQVRREWAGRSGEFSPEYYAYRGADRRSEAVAELLDGYVGPDAAILELGCSAGRHLAHLHERGYEDLAGVEVNADALDVLRETYPELDTDGTFHAGAFSEVLVEFPDDYVDAVFSVETLQHVHPDTAWVFEEVARITDSLLVTVETETDPTKERSEVTYVDEQLPLFHRDWAAVFSGLGLELAHTQQADRTTIRAFEG